MPDILFFGVDFGKMFNYWSMPLIAAVLMTSGTPGVFLFC